MTNNTSDDPVGSINISADESPETAEFEYTIEANKNSPERRIIKSSGSSKWKWLLPLPFLLFLFYLSAGYFGLPLCRTMLSDRLGAYLDRPVTVGGARFNPLTLTLTLRNGIIGPRLNDPDDSVDPVLSFAELEANINISSLFRRKLVCSQFRVNQLFFHLVRNPDNTYNLVQMIHGSRKKMTVPFAFALQNIEIEKSRILFSDRPADKTHSIEEISLALPALATPDREGTNIPFFLSAGHKIAPRFSALINGSPINLTGVTDTETNAMETRFHLVLKQIDLPHYLSYLAETKDFTIKEGKADLDLNLVMSQPASAGPGIRIEGSGRFLDLLVQDNSGRASRFPRTTITGSLAPPERTYRFQKIACLNPEIQLIRKKNGSIVVPIPPFTRKNKDLRSDLHIDHLVLKNGKLFFIDHHVNGGFTETVTGIDLTLDSRQDETETIFSLGGGTRDGGKISSQGRLSFSPLKIAGRLDMENIPVSCCSAYLASHFPLPLTQGVADKIKLSFSWEKGGKMSTKGLTMNGLSLDLRNLVLAEENHEWLRLRKVTVSNGKLSWPEKKLSLGRTTIDEGILRISRDNKKQWGWKFPREQSGSEKWEFALPRLAVSSSSLELIDHSQSPTQKIEVKDIALQTRNLTSQTNKPGTITGQARLAANGQLRFAGSLCLNPWQARLESRLEEISLNGVRPFIAGWFSPEITSGILTAEGALHLPEFAFSGFAKIKDFLANDNSGRKLISWQTAKAEKLHLRLSPFSLKAPGIHIDGGFLNWTKNTNEPAFPVPAAGSRPKAKEKTSVNIETLSLDNSILSFHDRTVSPHFAMNFTLSGTLTELGNATDSKTKFSLRGLTDDKAQCDFSGEGFFPASQNGIFHAKTRGQSITPFIPYLEKLFSHGIQEGMFDMDSACRQENDKVKLESRIILSGFKTGPSLQKKGTLDLTKALLQDQKGQIRLHLAGSEDENDPFTSCRGILARGLQNLRLKTAVSPFSLLSSLTKDGDTPADHLLFPYGEADLSKNEENQLQDLALILQKRPELTIEIRGFADDANDRRVLFARLQKEHARKKMIRESRSLEKVARIYGQEEIQPSLKPSSVNDRAEKQPTLNKSDLLELACRRATRVHDYLIKELKISRSRVILDTSGRIVPGHSNLRPGSRVDFILGAR